MSTSKLPYPFLRNCAQLILNYEGEVPFHLYLKQEFKRNTTWGSKDRKNYRHHCYNFWRTAQISDRADETTIIEWIKKSLEVNGRLEDYESDEKGGLRALDSTMIDTRYSEISDAFWNGFPAVSKDLATEIRWNDWFSKEAPVWIKVVRLSSMEMVLSALKDKGIEIIAEFSPTNAICIPGLSPVQDLEQQGHILIQDIGSQQSMILDHCLPSELLSNKNGMSMVWDACCGAGGKTLSLLLNYPNLDIQCSDIRTGILENLMLRFETCGLEKPFVFRHNLAESRHKKTAFKLVIADLPCSGSGTWRRNPEEKWFYQEQRWHDAQQMQMDMVMNAAKSVSEGGYLIVCTCSIFARENEELIEAAVENLNSDSRNWEVIDARFLGGIDQNGDYLYRTVLRKII